MSRVDKPPSGSLHTTDFAQTENYKEKYNHSNRGFNIRYNKTRRI